MRFARINATTDGDNEIVAASTIPEDKRICVVNYAISATAAGAVSLQTTESSATVLASFDMADGGFAAFNGTMDSPAFELPLGVGLEVSTQNSQDALGHIAYEVI